MAPLHVATLTVQRELPKYEIIFGTKNETMGPHEHTNSSKRATYKDRCVYNSIAYRNVFHLTHQCSEGHHRRGHLSPGTAVDPDRGTECQGNSGEEGGKLE